MLRSITIQKDETGKDVGKTKQNKRQLPTLKKTKKPFLRLWKQRLSMKENCHGWKSLLSSGLGYGKKMKKTPEMPFMEKFKIELREKVQNVNEFTITENKVVTEIRKKKTGQLQA